MLEDFETEMWPRGQTADPFQEKQVNVLFLTEQLVSQHVELLLVQASLGDGGELPAEDFRQLRPLGRKGGQEELEVLRNREVR